MSASMRGSFDLFEVHRQNHARWQLRQPFLTKVTIVAISLWSVFIWKSFFWHYFRVPMCFFGSIFVVSKSFKNSVVFLMVSQHTGINSSEGVVFLVGDAPENQLLGTSFPFFSGPKQSTFLFGKKLVGSGGIHPLSLIHWQETSTNVFLAENIHILWTDIVFLFVSFIMKYQFHRNADSSLKSSSAWGC